MHTSYRSCRPFHADYSWEEIGKELGCSANAAYMTYVNAIKKLRARPSRFRLFCQLVAERNRRRKVGNGPLS